MSCTPELVKCPFSGVQPEWEEWQEPAEIVIGGRHKPKFKTMAKITTPIIEMWGEKEKLITTWNTRHV